jgi:predicted AAA+ superfamily ATPase
MPKIACNFGTCTNDQASHCYLIVFFLFGARGTGKTHLLQSLFPSLESVLWIDLLRQGEVLQFLRSPNELRARLDGLATPPSFVVIDEVQRVPSLLNEVHSLIEERHQKFALTGSSARKLRRGAANLLAGRALLNHLFPLTFQELGQDFSLEGVLRWGSLPAVINEQNPDVRNALLRTYVDVYLREEIREEQLVRNLDPFARFLEASAQSSGHIVNFSKIAREAGTDSKGVARYFQILEDTLLGFFLEPYHSSILKRQRQHAKKAKRAKRTLLRTLQRGGDGGARALWKRRRNRSGGATISHEHA